MDPESVDSPEHFALARERLSKKRALRALYAEIYRGFLSCLQKCPREGVALELGSGAGFAKEVISEITTSDVVSRPGVDRAVNATKMNFADGELRFIGMYNVLHHLPDAEKFFAEAVRCLRPGGRLLIVDQYLGWISTPILRHAHDEPFIPDAKTWDLAAAHAAAGPMSGANGALATIIFVRDRAKFEALFPELEIVRITPHTPLRYWLSGGLKAWTLLPGWLFGLATSLDWWLVRITPRFASFMDIEIVRKVSGR